MHMKAGTYYVGDLCYVLIDPWDEVCKLIVDGHDCLDGQFNLSDGTRFAIFSTAYGDGVFHDQYGNEYCVDAGSIGCVLLEDLTEEARAKVTERKLGHVHEFKEPFWTYVGPIDTGRRGQRPSLITIGHVVIDTDQPFEEPEDYYEEEEEAD